MERARASKIIVLSLLVIAVGFSLNSFEEAFGFSWLNPTVSPTFGPPGAPVTVSISSCPASSPMAWDFIRVYVQGANKGQLLTENGCKLSFTLPPTPTTGNMEIKLTRYDMNYAPNPGDLVILDYQIINQPEITSFSPPGLYALQQISANGRFFPPNTNIMIKSLGQQIGTSRTNNLGELSATFAIGALSAGYYSIDFDWAGRPIDVQIPSINIQVYAPPPIIVNLNANPSSGDFPLDVEFKGSVSGGIEPYSYTFDPGDGSAPIQASWNTGTSTFSFDHKYTTAGTYTTTLSIIDTVRTTQLRSTNVFIFEPAVAAPAPPAPAPPPPPPPAPAPIQPPPPAPIQPPPPKFNTGSLFVNPDMATFFVDRYNPVSVTVSGTINDYLRGTPAYLNILRPDGTIDRTSPAVTKDGEFTTTVVIDVNWKVGDYAFKLEYSGNTLDEEIFKVARPGAAPVPLKREIPDTVKTTSKWWTTGQITDMDFVNNIQFMIRNNLIKVSGFEQIEKRMEAAPEDIRVPSWIKNMVKFWSDGDISDDEFLKGIEYLVENDIIDLRGKKRAQALGISEQKTSTPFSSVHLEEAKAIFEKDGNLDDAESRYLDIVKALNNNGIDVDDLLKQETFLKIIYDKIKNNRVDDNNSLNRLYDSCKSFAGDSILEDHELTYLKATARLV